MTKWPVAEKAPRARRAYSPYIAYIYVVALVSMVVPQLFAYEDFPNTLTGYGINLGWATLFAGLIVFSEIFAIPFLLRMRLSPLFRWFSLICSGLVPLLWAILLLVRSCSAEATTNAAVFGSKLPVDFGLWVFLWVVFLSILFAWSGEGLAPDSVKKSRKK